MEGGGTVVDSLATLTTAFSWLLERFTAMAAEMLKTPLFLIPVAIFAIGACIGLVKRVL